MGVYFPPATNTTDNMKVALALLACLAAVSANAVARQETVTEIENRILRKALSKVTETAVGEWTGDCGGWSIAQCAASLAATIATCVAAGFTLGLELAGCIGTADVCYDCICEVIEWLEMGTC